MYTLNRPVDFSQVPDMIPGGFYRFTFKTFGKNISMDEKADVLPLIQFQMVLDLTYPKEQWVWSIYDKYFDRHLNIVYQIK